MSFYCKKRQYLLPGVAAKILMSESTWHNISSQYREPSCVSQTREIPALHPRPHIHFPGEAGTVSICRVLLQLVRSVKQYHVHLPNAPASDTASALGTCLGLQVPSNFPKDLLQENMYASVEWRDYKSLCVHSGFPSEMTGLPS